MTGSSAQIDLNRCEQEAIHIPGSIQPHGALVVLDPASLAVLQASENLLDRLGLAWPATSLTLADFGTSICSNIQTWLHSNDSSYLRTATVGDRKVQVIGHRTRQGIILEFEDVPESESATLESLYPHLAKFAEDVQAEASLTDMCELVAREFLRITQFNRVLVYRFDRNWNGEVIAEASDGVLPSYLGLRFPASDIPAQARALYRANRLRLIPDANYRPMRVVPALCPADNAPLDLSGAALRSVSPVHLQYMRNMGTLASMSVSILVEGELWGLISCHNAGAKRVNAQVRNACDLMGKVVSLQIGARERASYATRRIELKRIEAELLANLGEAPSVHAGLAQNAELWMRLGQATGAAVVDSTGAHCVGEAPSAERVKDLAARLQTVGVLESFSTDSLPLDWPEFADLAAAASGLIAISISQLHPSYVMWFRPEVTRTVEWGGDPRKPVSQTNGGELHPRNSFEVWKEKVTLTAQPWTQAEIDSLVDFRHSIISFVLRRAEERAELTAQLQQSNRELESFSYSVSHDLRAPFRHIVGYTQLLREREKNLSDLSQHYLNSIVDAAASAGQLVDDLLNFSHLGRASLAIIKIDANKLVQESIRTLELDTRDRNIEWRIGQLPPIWGDAALLRQVFVNLLQNAVKYSRSRNPAVIEVSGYSNDDECVYTIKDNGVGFDMAYADKLFGVFQRLHRMEDYEGTGIGLALTKRIIDRHKGWIAAEGAFDVGATFRFGIPLTSSSAPHA
ncbi:MAG TPA: ATP-binding protein [Steroidobacteraceae bacterium]|nr:ATP-binding protein [Steroidobacteraceae bacterium]